ncbi:hypothetical protein HNV12_06635 [Methanococcoides sp. SA1]|nr:hypothetical protein [Methanococcoides sp. SA1]
MDTKIKPLSPIKIDRVKRLRLAILKRVLTIIWIILIGATLHVFSYYIYSLIAYGIFEAESLKYGVMVAVGAYFCVVIDKHKIDEVLNVKKDLPYIKVEDIEDENNTQVD